eukprot:jgi/Botrbrau1/3231/Bobra.174_1s0005.2
MQDSYSALFICEAVPTNPEPGVDPLEAAFNGGHYCLPAFRKALDLVQGLVLYHRAGDRKFGWHGNSELHLNPDSHRIAVVLYQRNLRVPKSESSSDKEAVEEEGEDGASEREDRANKPGQKRGRKGNQRRASISASKKLKPRLHDDVRGIWRSITSYFPKKTSCKFDGSSDGNCTDFKSYRPKDCSSNP